MSVETCECIDGCPFFNDRMKEKPGMAQMYKDKYCLGGKKNECARYIVRLAIGRENVPTDLYPNQTESARTIIEKFKKK